LLGWGGYFAGNNTDGIIYQYAGKFPLIVSILSTVIFWPGLMPAIFKAAWLAMAACPSIRLNITGRTGNNESSLALLGNCFVIPNVLVPAVAYYPAIGFLAGKVIYRI
jgi:hypothetical protein